MVRNVFNLPRTTHRYLLETVTDVPHLHVQLLSRYVTFVKSLLSNDAFEVCFLANIALTDKTTVIGKTVSRILDLCNHHDIETLNAKIVKKKIHYMKIPAAERWRVGVIENMRNTMEGRDQ